MSYKTNATKRQWTQKGRFNGHFAFLSFYSHFIFLTSDLYTSMSAIILSYRTHQTSLLPKPSIA